MERSTFACSRAEAKARKSSEITIHIPILNDYSDYSCVLRRSGNPALQMQWRCIRLIRHQNMLMPLHTPPTYPSLQVAVITVVDIVQVQ